MSEVKKLGFDIVAIGSAFNIQQKTKCVHLEEWMGARYDLNDFEQKILNDIHAEISVSSEQLNEEELKIRLIALLFYVANVDEPGKVRTFYERPLSAIINGYALSVVCNCMIATPSFNLPVHPYFFLQEFKKAKGEKKDPEAQMLTAMIIAQHVNADSKPVYGGYLIGSNWRFTTLLGNDYCVSRQFNATDMEDITLMAGILRKLKPLILNR